NQKLMNYIKKEKKLKAKGRQKIDWPKTMDTRYFLDHLGWRELITVIALSLLQLALILLYKYYQNERWLEESNGALIFFISLVLMLLMNHHIYYREHRRQNNYIGRVLSDIMFFISLMVVTILFGLIFNTVFFITFEGVAEFIGFFLIFCLVFLFFEIWVAFLKLILRLVRCRIL
ncbi:MAG: hypothetical protein MI749_17055, partial [Desulfovibrionales bacterium]|nr:hypothetical protein [Desulfovibrionales bacterium]